MGIMHTATAGCIRGVSSYRADGIEHDVGHILLVEEGGNKLDPLGAVHHTGVRGGAADRGSGVTVSVQ